MLLKSGYDRVKVVILCPSPNVKSFLLAPLLEIGDIVLDLLRKYIRTAIGQLCNSPLGGIDINLVCWLAARHWLSSTKYR